MEPPSEERSSTAIPQRVLLARSSARPNAFADRKGDFLGGVCGFLDRDLADESLSDFFDLRDGILRSFGARKHLIYVLKEGC